MKKNLSELLVYSDLYDRPLLAALAEARDAHAVRLQAKELLTFACEYGYSGDLWHIYLAWQLACEENPFTLLAEKRTLEDCTLTALVQEDCEKLMHLFAYNLYTLPGGECFRTLRDYRPPQMRDNRFACRAASCKRIEDLAKALASAENAHAFYETLASFYQKFGAGQFALGEAYRVSLSDSTAALETIYPKNRTTLADLVGYEKQKQQLVDNTKAFVAGRQANNVLLYGDAGTGKSTCVRALLHEYAENGLRIVQLYKHQMELLPQVFDRLGNRNYRFIVFIDDLSFEEHEVEYKFLKAAMEGGIAALPENVLLYATSNRRHLVRETWGDRADMEHDGDVHRSDTIEEKTSLSARFGVAINFNAPSPEEYRQIVLRLAQTQMTDAFDEDVLLREAKNWEIRHGGRSGRTAQQFIDNLIGKGSELSC